MDTFTKLSFTLSKPNLKPAEKLKAICMSVKSEIRHANVVSLWTFDNDFSAIYKIGAFDINNEFSVGGKLQRVDFPEYFDFILQSQVLKADSARNHPATSCFNQSYFEQNNIYSLLDYVYHHDFEPAGVICCEAIENEITWTDKDIEALKRIAKLSSIFFAKDVA